MGVGVLLAAQKKHWYFLGQIVYQRSSCLAGMKTERTWKSIICW